MAFVLDHDYLSGALVIASRNQIRRSFLMLTLPGVECGEFLSTMAGQSKFLQRAFYVLVSLHLHLELLDG